MVGAHRYPSGVAGEVVHAVRVGLAQDRVDEVVHLDLFGVPGRAPLTAAVLVRPDEFLLLGVYGDDRLIGGQVRRGLFVQVAELRVAVRVLATLDGLGVGLQ